MKRFMIDFILVLILVIIGSSIKSHDTIDKQINDFEETIHESPIENATENKATLFVLKSGEIIENVVEISVEVIASIFKAVIE